MDDQPGAGDESEVIRSFAAVARDFCELVERASTVHRAELLTRSRLALARLVAAAATLPPDEATSDEILVSDAVPRDWPGFGSHDLYWEVVDPYADEERGAASLSDDILDIYRDLKRGLAAFDEGQHRDAVWEWRFHFDHHWGEHAVDALRALQRACTATAGEAPASSARGHEPRVLVRTGGLVEETKISIGIHGPDVEPSAITELLGVAPTSHHRAGDARRRGSPWREGAWLFTVEGRAPRGPEEVAEELLAALPPADAAEWAELRSKHRLLVKVAVFVSGWNRGYVMSQRVLQRLSDIAGAVDFDIYAD